MRVKHLFGLAAVYAAGVFDEYTANRDSMAKHQAAPEWYMGLRNFFLKVPDAEMDEVATVFKFKLN